MTKRPTKTQKFLKPSFGLAANVCSKGFPGASTGKESTCKREVIPGSKNLYQNSNNSSNNQTPLLLILSDFVGKGEKKICVPKLLDSLA